MDRKLNDLYTSVKFSDELSKMFASILEQEQVNIDILRFIANKQSNKENVTLVDITDNIRTNRRVKVQKGKSYQFEIKETLIDRKSAERLIDKLSSMSLIYYEYMTPYKLLYITIRGVQVLKYLKTIEQENNSGKGV